MGRGRGSGGGAGSRPGAKRAAARGNTPKATEAGSDKQILAHIKHAIRHAERYKLAKGTDPVSRELVVIGRLRDHVEKKLGPIDAKRFNRLVLTERAKGRLNVESSGDSRTYTDREHDRAIPGHGSQSPFMYLYRPRRGREAKSFARH